MNSQLPYYDPAAVDAFERRRLQIRGLVQGVGFRPYVYRLAVERKLSGFVKNGPDGVTVEVQGCQVDAFMNALTASLPPLARIDSIIESTVPIAADTDFRIDASDSGSTASAAIPADSAICDRCLGELFDHRDRRYLHPFIACTDCGPRYTMTRRLPYDRNATSMADFALCSACESEYTDPANHRFHAEPVCCHDCGPSLSVEPGTIAERISNGDIVAIKGIGGFHLACDARNAATVARLRARKRRDGKPFAVMVLNTASAALFAQCNDTALQALTSQTRPVVVLPRHHQGESLPDALSQGLDNIGIMLPYTALHYLIFHALLGSPNTDDWLTAPQSIALVMTSANLSGDPLIVDNAAALSALAEIADCVVTHDRDIAARADDSVVRVAGNRSIVIRRARGFAPNAIALAPTGSGSATILGTGAHLKNTLALARGDQAWLSPHVGDLSTPNTIAFQRKVCEQLIETFAPRLNGIACDWHRDYASTRLAEALAERFDVPVIRVQHHHAHLAAVLAVNHYEGPALGIALDGHGLGERGESWGGELLRLDGAEFERVGHFAPLLAPGGDVAAREPWRLAAGALHDLGEANSIESRFSDEPLAAALAALLQESDCPRTTAAGRLFDCAAGLLGVSRRAAFEGEPPMRLESLLTAPEPLEGGFRLKSGVLDFKPLLARLAHCSDPVQGANWFHGTVLEALTCWAVEAAETYGVRTVALGGGCFLNHILATQLPERLLAEGLTPLQATHIPPNDGSISLGQTWVARRQLDNLQSHKNKYRCTEDPQACV